MLDLSKSMDLIGEKEQSASYCFLIWCLLQLKHLTSLLS